jgi:hypothetical protein
MSLHYDDKGKFYTDYVSKDVISAIIQTDTHRITGHVYLRSGERVSDMLNRSENFLAVTEATIYDPAGQIVHTCDFLAVKIDHIVWLLPEENRLENNGEVGS